MNAICRTFLPLFAALSFAVHAQELPARVTIISDAFGKPSTLERTWGYSALVEYGGKRILFDTGGQYKAFVNNVKALNIDLKRLDFVVLSHRHGDHTAGLAYVLQQNPTVKVFAPAEPGSFANPAGGPIAQAARRHVDGLPEGLRYFDGKTADSYPVDAPWHDANIIRIDKPTEVAPGVFLFRTVSDEIGTMELNEVSMAIKTPKGLVVVVGCSHPGIERILGVAATIDPSINIIVGGLHLVDKSDEVVMKIVGNFASKWKLDRVAAGHCTGGFAQTKIAELFKERHDHPGLGEVIALPK